MFSLQYINVKIQWFDILIVEKYTYKQTNKQSFFHLFEAQKSGNVSKNI